MTWIREPPDHRHPRLVRPVSQRVLLDEVAAFARAAGLERWAVQLTEHMEAVHVRNERRYAQTDLGLGLIPTFEFAPQTLLLPAAHRRGLVAHEVGHVLAGLFAPEGAADVMAERVFGVPIHYDPRWPGRGLEVAAGPRGPV